MEKRIGNLPKHYDWLVVGAGLFGATFAHDMVNAGKRVLVLERRDKVGGNIRCEKFDGVLMHCYGAHIFHTSNERVWQFVSSRLPLRPITHTPMARTGDGRMLSLPFTMRTFNALWPEVTTPAEARAKIEEQTREWRELYKTPENLEQKALTLVGRDIFDALIKGYTEKQWHTPCDQLPPEIITRLPLRFSWDSSYFDDKYVAIPEDGYNPLIDGLLDGADVITGVDYLASKSEFENLADRTLFTGCIDQYFNYALGRLGYRSLEFKTKIEDLADTQGCSVVNYTGTDKPWTRVIEHNQFAPSRHYEELVKSYEYPADFAPGAEPYYPIINGENLALYKRYEELAKAVPNICFGGRLGSYRYMDMDDAIEAALRLADKIIHIGY